MDTGNRTNLIEQVVYSLVFNVIRIVAFLLWVNFVPALAKRISRKRFNRTIDNGLKWFDNRPIFGSHKTIRGIITSLLGGVMIFPLLGVSWWAAVITALLAMVGDLITSFIKRRLDFHSGTDILLLDHFLESLLPTLFLRTSLGLSWSQVALIVLLFIILAYKGSQFWKFILFRPPLKKYPRVIRSSVRMREWRACHKPLSRWQTLFHLSTYLSDQVALTWFFKLTGLHERGLQNTLNVQVEEQDFWFPTLPEGFDNYRILLMTDLHLDGIEGLTDKLIKKISDVEVDLCLIGGDIRMKTYGAMSPCMKKLRKLLAHVKTDNPILGVLGNHDCIEMTPDFESSGMLMLINDALNIRHNGEEIWIVGVDDPHYYKVNDACQAYKNVPESNFSIFLAHSPEAYKEAASHKAQLYLCGHTHGGQVCFPAGRPILTNSRAPRYTAAGKWTYKGMTGYTSRGAGASSVPLRFNCPGEITLLTLRKGTLA